MIKKSCWFYRKDAKAVHYSQDDVVKKLKYKITQVFTSKIYLMKLNLYNYCTFIILILYKHLNFYCFLSKSLI